MFLNNEFIILKTFKVDYVTFKVEVLNLFSTFNFNNDTTQHFITIIELLVN
jgi:hypothetical protein